MGSELVQLGILIALVIVIILLVGLMALIYRQIRLTANPAGSRTTSPQENLFSPQPGGPSPLDPLPGGWRPPSIGEERTEISDDREPAPRPAYLQVVSSQTLETGHKYTLASRTLRIGRQSSDNDWVIEDRTVSLKHIEIWFENDAFYIHDVGSSNHTKVNGQSIGETRRLQEGDRISLGKTVLEFHWLDNQGGTGTRDASDPDKTTSLTQEHDRGDHTVLLGGGGESGQAG